MKRNHNWVAGGLIAVVLIGLLGIDSQASTINWNAQGAALTLADNSTLDPAGSLIQMGYFTISDSAVIAGASDPLTLQASFVPIDFDAVGVFGGTDFGLNGIWGASVSADFPLAAESHNIYLWAFNAATVGTATQQGIYEFANLFPSDDPAPQSLTIDLNDLFATGTVLVGALGTGQVATDLGDLSHVNLAAIPEPTAAFLTGCGLVLFGYLRRRR